ncbi:MAG: serine/threonine-protein kinase, partial [Acidobacteriota bacterium]
MPRGLGGMSTVFEGYDRALGRRVAIKFLRSDDPAMQLRLLREARLQARLHHPGICRIHDVGASTGQPFIVMEWIDGDELDVAAADQPLATRIAWVRQAASAVRAAHAAGLLHRDLKPSNVLVRRAPASPAARIVVFDIGLVWTPDAEPLTEEGIVMGAPAFAAPELLRGERARWGPALDVYGLGATLFHLTAGRPPFDGAHDIDVLRSVLREPAPDVRDHAPDAPDALARLLTRCLDKDPDRRPASMAALIDALDRAARAASASADRPRRTMVPVLRQMARRVHRTPWLPAAALAAVLMLIALGAILIRERDRLDAIRHHEALASDWEQTLRAARLGRPGGLPAAKAHVRQRMAAVADADVDDPALDGTRASALGRGHLALGDVSRASSLLARAWARGSRTPQTALAYALALGRHHADRLDDLGDDGRSHRARIADLLRWIERRGAGQATIADRPLADYVPALLAYYDRRYDDALRRAERLGDRHAWLYEARMLAADALAGRAVQEEDRGDIAAMRASHARASAAYARAIDAASGAPEPRIGRCAIAVRELRAAMEHGLAASMVDAGTQALAGWRDAARTDCRAALANDPDALDAYAFEARAVWEWARAMFELARHDARPALRTAIRRVDAALHTHPDTMRLHVARADLRALVGQRAMQFDRADPRAHYQRAVLDYRRALARRPDDALTTYLIGQVYSRQVEYEAGRALPIAPAWQQSLRHLVRAQRQVQRRPTVRLREAWIETRRAFLHRMVAFGQYRAGEDFGAHAGYTLTASQRALARGGPSGHRLRWMGNAYALTAFHDVVHGRDAAAALGYRQAVAYQERASLLSDGGIARAAVLLMGELDVARHDLARGVDPATWLRRAARTLARLEAEIQGAFGRDVAAWLRLQLAT